MGSELKLNFKLASREIIREKAFALFFIISLLIGLGGLCLIDSLQSSISQSLSRQSKGLLAADLAVGTRRALTSAERNTIHQLVPKGTKSTDLKETLTMVATKNLTSRLVELRIVQPDYPLYGEIVTEKQGAIRSIVSSDLIIKKNIWVYPELLMQLGLHNGETVKIGREEFEITDTILRDTASAGAEFSFAPPIYISEQSFQATGLDGQLSLVYQSHLLKFENETSSEATEILAKKINSSLSDPAIQVTTPKDASAQVGRVMSYLSDYLNLVALVGLLLASLGQFYILRHFFSKRLIDIAIFKSLGLSSFGIFRTHLIQLLTLTAFGLTVLFVFVSQCLPLLSSPLQKALGTDLELTLTISTLRFVTIVGLLQTLTLALPYWPIVKGSSVRALLQNDFQTSFGQSWMWTTPAATAFLGLAFWLSHSLKVGSLFLGLLSSGAILLALVPLLTFPILSRFARRLEDRLSFLHMARTRPATLSAFLVLSLGLLLSNLIPQIDSSLQSEISTPEGLRQPSLFLFDIQEEQVEKIESTLANLGVPISQKAPMIRARLARVNNTAFVKTDRQENWSREKENENRSRNRGYNLSYRDTLTSAETIVAGAPFSKNPQDEAQISLEAKFAARLGLKLGDWLTFDVQGIEISGRIVNFRKVRWTSFQPNFFIQFNSGPLNQAPKTYLLSLPELSPTQKAAAQQAVVHAFSNVAIIDVARAVDRILRIINQLSLALRVMATLTMLVGFAIFSVVIYNQIHERRKEANLLKVLGADGRFLRRLIFTELASLLGLAWLVGISLSYLISALLSRFIFEGVFSPEFRTPIELGFVCGAIGVVLAITMVSEMNRSKPQRVFQST